jgi:hypothetical protein
MHSLISVFIFEDDEIRIIIRDIGTQQLPAIRSQQTAYDNFVSGQKKKTSAGNEFTSFFMSRDREVLDRILSHRGIVIHAGGYFQVKKDSLTSVSLLQQIMD